MTLYRRFRLLTPLHRPPGVTPFLRAQDFKGGENRLRGSWLEPQSGFG